MRHRVTGGTWQRAAAVTLAMAATGAIPCSTNAQVPIDSMEIASVQFPGARSISTRILGTAVVTKPTTCYAVKPLCWLDIGVDRHYLDPRVLPVDSLRLWFLHYRRGFRESTISVDTVRDGERIRVNFGITEGRPVLVEEITFEGVDSLPLAITRNLPLRRDDPLDLTVYEATRDTITARLRNRGYARAEVLAGYDILRDRPYTAAVYYGVYPGVRARFGTIDVVGAQEVDSDVVRRMLTFRSGDVYSSSEQLRSQRNLFAQDVFRHAEIRADLDRVGEDTLINVQVQVNEGNIHRVRGGVGLSTAEFLNLEGRWVSRSFFGGARRLEVSGRVTNLMTGSLDNLPLFEPAGDFYGKLSGSLSTDFTQPWFFGPLNSFGAGIFVERRSIIDVFRRQGGGGHFTFTRSLGTNSSFTVGMRPELTQIEAPDGDFIFCAGFTACDPDDVEALSKRRWLSPVTLSVAKDASNSIFAPTRGYSFRIDAELATAALGSDFGYTRLAGEVIDYHTLTPGLVVAARLKPGWANALTGEERLGVHPQKRFFAGGPNSVRGFAQYQHGPKLLIADATGVLARPASEGGAGCRATEINDGSCDARSVAEIRPDAFQPQPVGGAVALEGNFELRFPVYGANLRGAAFLDFGQVWSAGDDVDLSGLAWTPGLGFRYFSPIGPIRIDLGYYGGPGETLTVLTTEVCVETPGGCVEPLPGMDYDPSDLTRTARLRSLDQPVLWAPRKSFFDRLQIHFSIGQAF